ncbi:GNAT family N-acetyltransferase [Streptomyces yaizuensis]|uniref:GNAT family N-acetyltransferase n=2 Tax=Streptomyces yaizuensis TaxID=2989713 RepID=A0ABQ5NTJ9_9ACTN|nr:GNAT family N-acetyltransferase [Streptomyces sp. YSPA8]
MRVLRPSEWNEWFEALGLAFGGGAMPAAKRDLYREVTHVDRSLAVWDGTEPVGSASSFPFSITVPGGGLVRAAGVTMVGVASTHRRRGILTSMMRRQLDDVRAWGEPVAALYASEPGIYGRFGYDTASHLIRAEIDTDRVGLTLPEGTDAVRIRRVRDAGAALAAFEEVYAAQVPARPGMIARLPHWDRLGAVDPVEDRAGASELLSVVAERDGRVTGCVRYRTRADWTDSVPQGRVEVRDLFAHDPASYAALLRHLWGIDLTSTVQMENRPVDDPWQLLVSDIRRCRVRVVDSLHVRLVDVGAALAARSYATPVDVVLEVSDPFCPWNTGRWRLSGDTKGAACAPTRDAADLSLSVRELAAAYLGGTRLGTLAAAGRVRELREGALADADAAFTSGAAPWGPHMF